MKGTYHNEAAVIESQLKLEVSLLVLLENTVEFSCIIPAGIFGNHLSLNIRRVMGFRVNV